MSTFVSYKQINDSYLVIESVKYDKYDKIISFEYFDKYGNQIYSFKPQRIIGESNAVVYDILDNDNHKYCMKVSFVYDNRKNVYETLQGDRLQFIQAHEDIFIQVHYMFRVTDDNMNYIIENRYFIGSENNPRTIDIVIMDKCDEMLTSKVKTQKELGLTFSYYVLVDILKWLLHAAYVMTTNSKYYLDIKVDNIGIIKYIDDRDNKEKLKLKLIDVDSIVYPYEFAVETPHTQGKMFKNLTVNPRVQFLNVLFTFLEILTGYDLNGLCNYYGMYLINNDDNVEVFDIFEQFNSSDYSETIKNCFRYKTTIFVAIDFIYEEVIKDWSDTTENMINGILSGLYSIKNPNQRLPAIVAYLIWLLFKYNNEYLFGGDLFINKLREIGYFVDDITFDSLIFNIKEKVLTIIPSLTMGEELIGLCHIYNKETICPMIADSKNCSYETVKRINKLINDVRDVLDAETEYIENNYFNIEDIGQVMPTVAENNENILNSDELEQNEYGTQKINSNPFVTERRNNFLS